MIKKRFLAFAIGAVLWTSGGCVSRSKIEMNATNPPTFAVYGGALFDWCDVYAESQGNTPIWKIRPSGTPPSLSRVSSFSYGKVPAGFEQSIPTSGEAPPLIEGKVYYVRVIIRTPDSIQIAKSFIIKDSKAEEVQRDGEDQYTCKDLFHLYCL